MDMLTAGEHTAALVRELERHNLEAHTLASSRLWTYSEDGRAGDTLVQRQGPGSGDDTAWFSYTERRNFGRVTEPAAVAAMVAESLHADRKCPDGTRPEIAHLHPRMAGQ